MKSIDDIIQNDLDLREIMISRISANSENIKPYSLELRFIEYRLAIKSLILSNYKKAKQHFYVASLLDKLRVERFNDRIFDFGLPHIGYPIISDNDELIFKYSVLRYQQSGNMASMDEMVKMGESAIWCNTVQFFMAEDFEGVKRNIEILETKTLPKLPKNQQELKVDYEFYKALLDKNRNKCEALLDELVSPKIHKKRNDNPILGQYVSQPALGYAKLAWRIGVEVDVHSSLVPKGILPIEPLDHYEIPYDFLKE